YPQYRNKDVGASKPRHRLFDFKIDMNSIIIAIRDQSGIDLSKRKEPFHWWRFLLEFYNLTPEHHICKLMELRAYDGDDKEMKRARDAVALPVKISKRQKRFEDEMDKIFYNC
ncbi:MAG: Gp15 family bacteriophage protein, partial [Bacillota bacterium]|nr:Gp15 family bacteriophage protein [Bacillota bacterium]